MIKHKYRNKKLRESAKHEACVSCGCPDSCWAHSNELKHGKGTSDKAHDLFGAYLCQMCHDWFDGRSNYVPPSYYFMGDFDSKDDWFIGMWERSMIIACEKGYL